MRTSYELDLSKSNIAGFSELVLAVLEQLMKIGQELVSGTLRRRDTELLMERDASRFRCKEAERIERYAELAEQSAGSGTIAAPILYEENDGVLVSFLLRTRPYLPLPTIPTRIRR